MTVRNHFLVFLLFFACVVVGIDCRGSWNRANQRGLESDATSLLRTIGVQDPQPNCEMVGTTRNGYCLLDLTPREQRLVIEGLGLVRLEDANDLARFGLNSGGCLDSIFQEIRGTLRYAVSGRPESLRLSSGSAFEFLILSHCPSQTQVCLDLGYAYG